MSLHGDVFIILQRGHESSSRKARGTRSYCVSILGEVADVGMQTAKGHETVSALLKQINIAPEGFRREQLRLLAVSEIEKSQVFNSRRHGLYSY